MFPALKTGSLMLWAKLTQSSLQSSLFSHLLSSLQNILEMDLTVLKSFTNCLALACLQTEKRRENTLDNEFFSDATVWVVYQLQGSIANSARSLCALLPSGERFLLISNQESTLTLKGPNHRAQHSQHLTSNSLHVLSWSSTNGRSTSCIFTCR